VDIATVINQGPTADPGTFSGTATATTGSCLATVVVGEATEESDTGGEGTVTGETAVSCRSE
jgi:hypothetical protein